MKNQTFSIVIPVYNRAKIVCRTLDSVKMQTYRPIHLIVVDNNSSDESLATIKSWKEANENDLLKITCITENKPGAAAARNAGLKSVDSELMMFFDSDDTMRPSLVEDYVDAFHRNNDAKIIYTRGLLHNTDGSTKLLKFATRNILRNHIYHAILKTLGYAVRTNHIRSVGGWNESVGGWDDWELGIRLMLPNPVTAPLDKISVDIYAQENSITGSSFTEKEGQWEYAMEMADKAIRNSGHTDSKSLLRLIDYRRIVLAAHYRKERNYTSAKRLYHAVMQKNVNDFRMRILMPVVYRYVSLGGRGAASIIDFLL